MNIKANLKNIKESLKNFNLIKFIKETYQKLKQNKWVRFVVFNYVIAFIAFSITLINNHFTIPVSGDFVLQEIPFYYNGYDDWWKTIKTGQFVLWDDSGMLGQDNIASNSFYYLFNPFFLVLLLWPRAYLAQGQAFMMITKIVLSAVSMKLLLEKFKLKEETTWMISLAYAFCGWNLYYLWFNHFMEMVVLMPLLLLGIEKVIRDKKALMLIIVIFVTGITNYFYLICFCFGGVLYAIVRYFQCFKMFEEEEIEKRRYGIKGINVKGQVLLLGIFSFLTGLLLSSVVVVPGFANALNNTRVTSQTYLTDVVHGFKNLINAFKGETSISEAFKVLNDVLFKWSSEEERRLTYPLIAIFTHVVSCFDSVVLVHSSYDNTYSSLYIYAPLLLMFIPSVIQAFKNRAVSTGISLLGVGVLLFTPFAYYCFSGFTSVAYARWYIFLTAFACVFIAVQYDKKENMSRWYLDISMALVMFFYGYLIYKGEYLNETLTWNIKDMDLRIYYLYGQIIFVFIIYLYMRKKFRNPELTMDLRYAIAFEAIVMVNATLVGQGTVAFDTLYHGYDNIKEEMAIMEKINEEDDSYFRTFSTTADRNGSNLGMMLNTKGMGTFHSNYNAELVDFLDWSAVQYNGSRSSWSMGIHEKRINLDQFLGVKYYLVKKGDNNIPFGFKKYYETNNHDVYINENFIELGYAFDTLIMAKEYEDYNYYYADSGAMVYRPSTLGDNDNYPTWVITNEKGYLTGAILYENDLIELYGEDYKNNPYYDVIDDDLDLKQDITFLGEGVLSNDYIKVYYADWEGSPTFGGKYIDEGQYGKSVTRGDKTYSNYNGLTWNSYLSVDTSSFNIGSECASRGKCYVTVQARMGENLLVTLYGEKDGEEYIITSDKHITQWFSKSNYDFKRQRGYYVDDKVTRIEVRVQETMADDRSVLKPYISYQYYDSFKTQIDELKSRELQNIKIGVNDFTFDYDSRKFIVLQIPYDKGWKLEVFDKFNNKLSEEKTPKIYKGQGGFIAFESLDGEYKYKVKFVTPYLSEGLYVMSVGFMFMSLYLVYDYFKDINRYKLRYDLALLK